MLLLITEVNNPEISQPCVIVILPQVGNLKEFRNLMKSTKGNTTNMIKDTNATTFTICLNLQFPSISQHDIMTFV